MKRLTYILLFTLCITQLYAEPKVTRNYTYRYFTTRDGLVQMQVLCAFQDRDGYMWFGTKGGVSRYDGISFKSYTQDDGIPVGEMFAISEWGNKKIFHFHYQFQILHENDSLELVQFPDSLISEGRKIKSIDINENEILFLNLINPSKKRFFEKFNTTQYHYIWNKNSRRFKRWHCINKMILSFNSKYILTSNALYTYKGLNVKKIQTIPDKYIAAEVNWLSGEFYLYSIKDSTIDKYYLKNGELKFQRTILKNIINYEFTLIPNQRIIYFDEKSIPHIYPSQESGFNMDMAYIQNIFTDREGNLWVSSNNGLYNLFNLNIEEFTLGLAKPDNIWSVLEDNEQKMWFGSYGHGLWCWNKKGQLKSYNKDYIDWLRQYMGSTRSKDGTLYMPNSKGLTVFKNNKFTNLLTGCCLSTFYDEVNKNIYYSGFIIETNVKGLWIGTDKNRKFLPSKIGFPIAIGKDNKGEIRVGSFHGQGYVKDNSTIVVDTIKKPYEGIISFALDKWGRLWKATTKGVYVEMPDGKEYRFAPQVKGLVASVLNYHDKYLLIGSGYGMAIAELKDNMFYNPLTWEIGSDAGFTGLESGQNGMCIDHNGDVWMTTATCVLKFNPEKLVQSQRQFIPPIRVSRLFFSMDNANWEQRILPSPLGESLSRLNGRLGGEVLPSSNKFLRFEYIANSISAPRSLRFKYRLKGFSDEWSQVVYTKTAEFTNLGYGKYQFEVQCSLDGVHWSPVASSPVIQILTPFLLRWYMWVLYALLFIILIIGITLYISKRKEKKRTELLSRQKLENELQLRTLHSKVLPHFTKNVLTAIGHFAMDDNRKAGKYIAMFSKFTQLTLANSDKNYNTLEDELNYVQTYLELEQMRFGDKFSFKIETDKDVETHIYIPAMALHTYCDNAIRHGIVNKKGDGELMVTVKRKLDATLIVVSDNGIGRKRSAELGTQGNQMGLKLVQQQLDFYNKLNESKIKQVIIDLEDEDGNALGTQIELLIPDGYIFSSEQLNKT